jgi:hypothetical protein
MKMFIAKTDYTSQIKLKPTLYGMEGTWTDSSNQKEKLKWFKIK